MNLSVLPAPLLRLVLLGGGGLGPAWGPMTVTDDFYGRINCVWGNGWAVGYAGYETDGRWRIGDGNAASISLFPSSPWPARLALVAAHLLGGEEIRGASVYLSDPWKVVCAWLVDGDRESLCWHTDTGDELYCGGLCLPTLPAHLAQHPPEVALLLALWDVPDVRARVEGVTR